MRVVKVPVLDTGLGREAGYEDDAALIEAAKKQREEMRALLTPEAWAEFERTERESMRRFIGY